MPLVATWNVNSIVARKDRALAWLEKAGPDIVCLQELKCQDPKFPFEELKELGYEAATHGQKTYNGVAILAKAPIEVRSRGFEDGVDDPQARFLCAQTMGLTIMSAYCPNGGTVDSDKYQYKMDWYQRLRNYLDQQLKSSDPLILAGDFNVAPEDIDCHDPKAWEGSVLFTDKEKAALTKIKEFGFSDIYRRLNPEEKAFSWWDYRSLGFQLNKGMRIDFILATDSLTAKARKSWIDRDERKGTKPSDHAPVLVEFG